MPKCQNCGNIKSFGASQIPPAGMYANGPLSGIIGEFKTDRELMWVHSSGATKSMINAACHEPQKFFDICVQCGYQSVLWSEEGE
ncbi:MULTISPECIES: hypothetical protein [Pelosinus]|uniref:Uncharacterized protein n=2 Tax=Pelosinus TaxID=365348 RepID=I9NQ05_9FIRM|nr:MULTISPECIES: hypothetical protein [Pelosinus]AJQ28227.1 hypothetical protein JBW_02884 [Pelosinus fermentans JBW45]MCC5465141.1 hypothetical protein [Pelosinus baikalensis]MCC5465244.1 hypothetical protein [Pelosinus baikalensis]